MERGEPAKLAPREEAIVAYTRKLTIQPNQITADDVAPLRDVGLSDRALHDLVQVAAYYAYANRIALGLGVEMLPDEPLGAWPRDDEA